MVIKDANYWKEYNRKRREYLNQKEKERRQKAKGVYNSESHVQPKSESVQPVLACTTESTTKESVQPAKVVHGENNVQPKEAVKPCSLNHYSFTELFKEVTEQVRKDYQTIYQKYPESVRKCFDCHNRERNYQIMLKLLNSYWNKTKYEQN